MRCLLVSALGVAWLAIAPGGPLGEAAADDKPVPVKVQKQGGGRFELLRGGSPYFIKGGGGTQHLAALREAGGNSLRTWGVDNLGGLLDEARRSDLTVAAGIWLGHPRHGFRYDDERAVRGQFDSTRAAIRRHKDHPALLLWGLGNEMEGDGADPKVWRAINDLARMAHAEDPDHPTMTVIAELGKDDIKVEMFRRHCPDVDILGVNSYGGAGSVGERLARAKFDRPFIITEFGPSGFWEGPQTPWKAAIEPVPAAKAETYRATYARGVAGHPGRCLGSYAFLWGQKQEVTPTWFSLFLPTGEKTEAVDVLSEAWTGKPPGNRAPHLTGIAFDGAAARFAPGSEQRATVRVTEPDGDPLSTRWEVRAESSSHHEGGDREAEPPAVAGAIRRAEGTVATFRAPDAPGAYRLFFFAYDGRGGAASANLPFQVAP